MKSIKQFALMAFTVISIFSCGKLENDLDEPIPVANREVVTISGKITTNTTWTSNKKYLLTGFVYVESGATLTINAGTIIKGDLATKGTLIIKPGAKIIAEGNVTNPIVFTSNQAIGARKAGDWGGIVILGNAKVNKNPITIEGENISSFGGTDDADNSGILKYVRIEFAGIAFETDKEINGLTLGGVGKGTTIDYVQVSYSGDDAYEWFGGNVDAKHLIAYGTLDDDFDTDNGFSGNIQFGLSLRDPKIADQCSCSDSNGMESDNDGSGSTAVPQTSAKFANLSFIFAAGDVDKKYRSAFRIRRNSAISIYNTIVYGDYPKAGLELEGTTSQANFKNKTSDYQGLSISGMKAPILGVDEPIFTTSSKLNILNLTKEESGFLENFNQLRAPQFSIKVDAKGIKPSVALPSGFETVNYRGAFDGSNDWTAKWTNFDPQQTTY